MKNPISLSPLLLPAFLLALTCMAGAQGPPDDLAGTSWQLVRFQGSDDKTLTPDDPSKYTLAFDKEDGVSVRVDCNRGRGTWKSAGPNQLQFGPRALTRAMCPPAPLNDCIPRDWEYVRSYILKDGHLFLALMADGGICEFEPANREETPSAKLKGTSTYRERMALPGDAVFEAALEDVSKADAPAEVVGRTRIEHPGNPPIAFEIPYDPSRIDPSHRYAVRARILVDGKLFFATVLGAGQSDEVTLLLRRAGACLRPPSHGLARKHLLEAHLPGRRLRESCFPAAGTALRPQLRDPWRQRIGRLQSPDRQL